MRRISKIVTGGVLALALGVSTASAVANAEDHPGDYTGPGVNIRQTGNLDSVVLGMGYQGQGLMAKCSAQGGSNVDGETHWIKHSNNQSKIVGYSIKTYVTWSGGIPYSSGSVCNG
ncbi:MAG: hypothetical protein LBI63_00020 [Candidatus Ancillula sp.]|jgi:hypothetical protein|nr:hypothetical protein [Candidatus Ancillula sp.]